MTKKTKAPKSILKLELIGGIYAVEEFPDGKQIRDEIDGEVVLRLMIEALRSQLDMMGEQQHKADTKSKCKKKCGGCTGGGCGK